MCLTRHLSWAGSPCSQADAGLGPARRANVEQERASVMDVGRARSLVHALIGRGNEHAPEIGANEDRTARLPRRHGDTPDDLTLRGIGVQARAAPDGAPNSSPRIDDCAVQPARTAMRMQGL